MNNGKNKKIGKVIIISIIIFIAIFFILAFSKIKLHTYNPIRAIIGYIQVTMFDKEYVEVCNIPTKTIYANSKFNIEKYMEDKGYTKLEKRTIKVGDDWYTYGETSVFIESFYRRGIIIYEFGYYRPYNEIKEDDVIETEIKVPTLNDIDEAELQNLTKEISVEYAVEQGWFVVTGEKVYNKNVLDRFIKNTEINAKNRIEDKIRIVVYNVDGYPTIYDLEYKIFDETYINERQEKVNKTGYILTTDATRNNIIPRDIIVNNDIPGEVYGITLKEYPEINAVSITLSLYAEINYVSSDIIPYEDIEISRYLLDAEVINKT